MSETENTPVVKSQRTLVGRVVSNKMNKTVVVEVERRVKHPVYGKIVMRSNRYKAHDETNQYNEGDTVEIAEGRPISRDKSWTVVRLVTPAHVI
ncbi:MAG TPA: 30S ribosomal protein S17 [Paralcaligenes sp.]|jgi:small subunit ribosomal protein S17